jgi:16S rRNA processing protein RimM
MSSQKTLVVGKFGKPYGLKGWVNVYSFTEPEERLFDYSPLFIETIGSPATVLSIETFKSQGHHWVIKLSTCQTRDDAARYTHKLIKIQTHQLKPLPKGEYYWNELKGLKVLTTQNEELGVIVDLLQTGSNDVLIVKGQKTHYIPYHPTYVISVDIPHQKIIVDWDKDF